MAMAMAETAVATPSQQSAATPSQRHLFETAVFDASPPISTSQARLKHAASMPGRLDRKHSLFAAVVEQAKAKEKAESAARMRDTAATLSRMHIRQVNAVTKHERNVAGKEKNRAIEEAIAVMREQFHQEKETAIEEAMARYRDACSLEWEEEMARAIEETRADEARMAAEAKAAALMKASVAANKSIETAIDETNKRNAAACKAAVAEALDAARKEAAESQAAAVAAAIEATKSAAAEELAAAVAKAVATEATEAMARQEAAVATALEEAAVSARHAQKEAVARAIEQTNQEWALHQQVVVERVTRAAVAESMTLTVSDALEAAEQQAARSIARVTAKAASPRARQRLDSALAHQSRGEGEDDTATTEGHDQPSYIVATALKQHQSTLKALVMAEKLPVPLRAAKATTAGPAWSYMDTSAIYGRPRRPPSAARSRIQCGGPPAEQGTGLRRTASTPTLEAVLRGQSFVNVLLPF